MQRLSSCSLPRVEDTVLCIFLHNIVKTVASFLYFVIMIMIRGSQLLKQRRKQKDTKSSLKLPHSSVRRNSLFHRGQLCCVLFGPNAFTSQRCMNNVVNVFDLLRASLIW